MPPENQDPQPSRQLAVEELLEQLGAAADEGDLETLVERIAEQSGASPATVETAILELRKQKSRRRTWWGRLRAQIAQMGEATRRTVTSAFLGLQAGLIATLGAKFGDDYGLGSVLQAILLVMAVYNTALSRRRELASLVGLLFGAAYVVGRAFFSTILQPPGTFDGIVIFPYSALGGLTGWLLWGLRQQILRLRFQHDPEARRKELLKQLIELQEELRVGERTLTFLAVDVVDSTGIKAESEPLAVEYTFGEYARYAQAVADRYDGRLHSAAGDGLIFAFENPHDAFLAAKRIQLGMIEFNAHLNRTARPFLLRCGIHTGRVVTPIGNDPSSVNYSHVIDVASHLEKAAPMGGIAVSSEAARLLPASLLPKSEPIQVRGVEAVLWQPAADLSNVRAATPRTPPPPLPKLNP